MPCEILRVDPQAPDAALIGRAAAVLRGGGLVAFPTETVYGLGANALDAAAVGRIFAAKGRPTTNPLIVHVPDVAAARTLVTDWPAAAQQLADHFWPGPLTLVLPRTSNIPDAVTAGGPTVALRIPSHPVALALLRAAQLPLAAPSANRSTRLSPTRAEHVLGSLADRIGLLLDAGPTTGGLESTVLDLTARPPRLLRPGLVSPAELEAVVGPVARPSGQPPQDGPLRSPGQMEKHYAPRTQLECSSDSARRINDLCDAGLRVGWLRWSTNAEPTSPSVLSVPLPPEPAGYAAGLYAALYELDDAGLDRIVVETPPPGEEWLAVHDRLRRAAARGE
jgi:L-threonylcarbamoyladenylate synthase